MQKREPAFACQPLTNNPEWQQQPRTRWNAQHLRSRGTRRHKVIQVNRWSNRGKQPANLCLSSRAPVCSALQSADWATNVIGAKMKLLLKASPPCCEEKNAERQGRGLSLGSGEAEGQLDAAFMCPSCKRTFFYIVKCRAQNRRLSILWSGDTKGWLQPGGTDLRALLEPVARWCSRLQWECFWGHLDKRASLPRVNLCFEPTVVLELMTTLISQRSNLFMLLPVIQACTFNRRSRAKHLSTKSYLYSAPAALCDE